MNSLQTNFNKQISYWLFFVSLMIISMILIGGATRLTGSGLSMVEWRPFLGLLPPLTENEWIRVFDLYKLSPEYININSWMTLDDFKVIFFWEYFHRVWGRLIGLVFILPFSYFLFAKKLNKSLLTLCSCLLVLGGIQGLIGWWMVKSGLTDNPYVSQYRLSIHLSMAFLILMICFWNALNLFKGTSNLPKGINLIAIFLVSLTILAGTFVSGMDAGLIYNQFPLMGEGLVPIEYGDKGILDPFENPVSAQFHHRVLASITLLTVIFVGGLSIFRNGFKLKSILLIAAILFQFFIGILTLIYMVPTALGVLHQFGGVILFLTLIWFSHEPNSLSKQ